MLHTKKNRSRNPRDLDPEELKCLREEEKELVAEMARQKEVRFSARGKITRQLQGHTTAEADGGVAEMKEIVKEKAVGHSGGDGQEGSVATTEETTEKLKAKKKTGLPQKKKEVAKAATAKSAASHEIHETHERKRKGSSLPKGQIQLAAQKKQRKEPVVEEESTSSSSQTDSEEERELSQEEALQEESHGEAEGGAPQVEEVRGQAGTIPQNIEDGQEESVESMKAAEDPVEFASNDKKRATNDKKLADTEKLVAVAKERATKAAANLKDYKALGMPKHEAIKLDNSAKFDLSRAEEALNTIRQVIEAERVAPSERMGYGIPLSEQHYVACADASKMRAINETQT